MYLATTEFSFDSAHRLQGHNGRCKNLHGHRWRIEITLQSKLLITNDKSSEDMIMDFTDIKKINKYIEELFDHKTILTSGDYLIDYLKKDEVVILPFRTTAENLAKHFYKMYNKLLEGHDGISVYIIKVYETPNNCITYFE